MPSKKLVKRIVVILIILILISVIIIAFLSFSHMKKGKASNSGVPRTPIKNPTAGLSLEEAVAQFNESFVYYLLLNIKANELHNPPLSSDNPKINFYIGEKSYKSEIIDGHIRVSEGLIEEEDIIIRTTTEEAVKMVMDKNYIADSFKSGSSQIELVASQAKLFAKGYLNLYNKLTA